MPYTQTIQIILGSSKAGLALKARLFDLSGVSVGPAILSGFVEIGGGDYHWTYAGFTDVFNGSVRIFDASTDAYLASALVGPPSALSPAEQAQLDEILNVCQQFNPSRVESSAAVLENGFHVVTVRGDDYLVGSPRGALEWSDADNSWPDLTDAVVVFTTRRRRDDVIELSVVGQVINAVGPNKKIRVQLTAAQTALLTPGVGVAPGKTNKFDVQVTLASGVIWTPIRGGDNLGSGGHTIIEDQTRAG